TGPVVSSDPGPPPTTTARAYVTISPNVLTQAQTFVVHEQAATVPPLQTLNGEAKLVAAPPAPVPVYAAGNIPFSATTPLFARGTVRDGEPSIRVDVKGNCYVGGIRGVPAGVDMWRFDLNPGSGTFDPEMKHAAYLGQPDVFQQTGAEDS